MGVSVEAKGNVISSWVKFDCILHSFFWIFYFSKSSSLFMECNIVCGIIEEDNPTSAGQPNIASCGLLLIPEW